LARSDNLVVKLLTEVDVSMCVTGPLVQSFYNHFIQRWNFVRKDILIDEFRYPKLDPSSPVLQPATGDSTSQIVKESIIPLGQMVADRLHLGPTSTAPPVQGIRAQLCRSASKWSQGVPTEKSIQNAYISLIENAERTFSLSLIN
jgi:phospholipase D1/2